MDVGEEVEVVPDVVVLSDVLPEIGLSVGFVDHSLIHPTDQTVVLQMVPLLILFCPQNGEIIDDYSDQHSEEYLESDDDVDILED